MLRPPEPLPRPPVRATTGVGIVGGGVAVAGVLTSTRMLGRSRASLSRNESGVSERRGLLGGVLGCFFGKKHGSRLHEARKLRERWDHRLQGVVTWVKTRHHLMHERARTEGLITVSQRICKGFEEMKVG